MILKASYILLSLLMVVILLLIGFYAIHKSVAPTHQNKKKSLLLIGLIGWQIYLFALASTGLLQDLSFPPRFVIFMILPAFLFVAFFLRRNKHREWIQRIPIHWLTGYQTFRILIETIFVYSVAAGVLHKNVTIEGYNYDMVFACTAPIMTLFIYRAKVLPVGWIKLWNYAGLLVIAVIITLFQTTIYTPDIYGPDTAPFPVAFGAYPYVLVPGFLMPSAVFIHVLSLVKLTSTSDEK